jgi:hypothetical protein
MVIGLALSATAFGANRAPGEQVLADMGLSNLQILSDAQAAFIRGAGFSGFETLRNTKQLFYHTVKTANKVERHVDKQVRRIDHKISKLKRHTGGY